MSGNGPFQTPQDAARFSPWELDGRLNGRTATQSNLIQIHDELSGVELGEWDDVVLRWLAGYEPSTVSVICGLIHRVRQIASTGNDNERG